MSLYGTWYVVNRYPDTNDSLVFGRQSGNSYNWGDRIEIFDNGDFVNAYSAKCGNDDRIHNVKGHWTLDQTSMILTATVAIYMQDTAYKLSMVNADKLVLQRINKPKTKRGFRTRDK